MIEKVEKLIRELGFANIKLYDKHSKHYIAYISSHRYYIIYTNSVLENPRTVFGKDFGEMLGVRSSILTQDVDFIVWIVERNGCVSVYMQRSYAVHSFCLENGTVYRNKATGEYICNYPLSLTRKVYEKCNYRTLMDYR